MWTKRRWKKEFVSGLKKKKFVLSVIELQGAAILDLGFYILCLT